MKNLLRRLYGGLGNLLINHAARFTVCSDGYIFHRWDEWVDGPLCDFYVCGRCDKEIVLSNWTGEGFRMRPPGSPIITVDQPYNDRLPTFYRQRRLA